VLGKYIARKSIRVRASYKFTDDRRVRKSEYMYVALRAQESVSAITIWLIRVLDLG